MKWLAKLFFVVLAVSSGAAIAEAAVLRVGTSADINPLIFQADGKIVGLEADLARLLERSLGQSLEFRVMPANELFPALSRGEIDMVMAGLTITPEREKAVDFTLPYLHTGLMAIIRTDDVMRFRSAVVFTQGGYRVGFVGNSPVAGYVKAEMSAATPSACANTEECLEALVAKRIDVFVDAPTTSWRIATEKQYASLLSFYRPLTDDYYAWAVSKSNPKLRERLDNAVREIKTMQMFEHVLNRWIPVRVSSD